MAPRFQDHRLHVDYIIRAVLRAADPGDAVRRHWKPLPPLPTLLLAIGKASRAMTAAALECIGDFPIHGIVTAPPELASPIDPRVAVYACDHPLPTERNTAASRAIANAIRDMHALHGARWQLLFLVSGGGSSHLTLPAPGLALADLRRLNTDLQHAGASISVLNAVRKRTELLKGGRLGLLVHPAPITLLVASDVIGDKLDVIASGPVSADESTVSEAIETLRACGLASNHSAVFSLLQNINQGTIEDTPKRNDSRLARVMSQIICSNVNAVLAAKDGAQSLGFMTPPARLGMTGDTRRAADSFIAGFPEATPASHVAGGETTVNLGSSHGKGGPSQEFALACSIEMARRFEAHGHRSALVAYSTDGIDGPTDAAGAIVTHETHTKLRALGIDAQMALSRHDSHHALDAVGSLLRTGPTGTNVNHVVALLVYPPEP